MAMHPDYFSDPVFARCYQQWQARPTSAAFVGVADLLRLRGAYDDAITVCREGLRHNPQLVTGRLVLAQALEALGRRTDAHAVVLGILADVPEQTAAKAMAVRLALPAPPSPAERKDVIVPAPAHALPLKIAPHSESSSDDAAPMWETITMARLYAAQGYRREAERVYRAILARDPQHDEARAELAQLTHML